MNLDMLFPLGFAHYLAGGLIIGAGVSLLFLTTGLIGGTSTVFSSTWSFVSRHAFFQQARLRDSRAWRLVYAAGLILGAAAWWLMAGQDSGYRISIPWWQLALGGFVAGFGARMSNGCTAGHGICGIGSLQLPSLLAVVTFLATAMITARLVLMVGGS